jgi:hypothetical protein
MSFSSKKDTGFPLSSSILTPGRRIFIWARTRRSASVAEGASSRASLLMPVPVRTINAFASVPLLCAKHSTGHRSGASARQERPNFKLRHYPGRRSARSAPRATRYPQGCDRRAKRSGGASSGSGAIDQNCVGNFVAKVLHGPGTVSSTLLAGRLNVSGDWLALNYCCDSHGY